MGFYGSLVLGLRIFLQHVSISDSTIYLRERCPYRTFFKDAIILQWAQLCLSMTR